MAVVALLAPGATSAAPSISFTSRGLIRSFTSSSNACPPARFSLLPAALPLGFELLRSPLAAAAAADDDVWLPDKKPWNRALFLCFCLSASSSSAFLFFSLLAALVACAFLFCASFSACDWRRVARYLFFEPTFLPPAFIVLMSERRGAAQAIGASSLSAASAGGVLFQGGPFRRRGDVHNTPPDAATTSKIDDDLQFSPRCSERSAVRSLRAILNLTRSTRQL